MTIAPAVPGDAEWCAQLMAASDPWLRLGRGYDDCLPRCTHPEYTLLLARAEDARRLGFVLVHPRGMAGSPYIAAIAVAAEARRAGVGAALVDAAAHAFPTAKHLFLCVSSFNERALALYERLGFERAGELRNYVIEGASEIIMHQRLVQR